MRAKGANKAVSKSLLCFMPWSRHRVPSLQIASLKAYAGRDGFEVDARHLHLEIAAEMGDGCDAYERICEHDENPGEALALAILYPEKKFEILRWLKSIIRESPDRILGLYEKALRKIYGDVSWGEYSLIGFSVGMGQVFTSILFASWIKRDFPEKKVVFGGSAVRGRTGRAILESFSEIDWIVEGEGEIAFVELLRQCASGKDFIEGAVPGLVRRCADNVISANKTVQLRSLKHIPIPEYESYFDFLERSYALKGKWINPSIFVESSRGCANRCAFCNVGYFFNGYRVKDPKQVAREMRHFAKAHQVVRFDFTDPSADFAGSDFFCEISRDGIEYRLTHEVRADASPEALLSMRRAGVKDIEIGIESFSSSLLKKMRKGVRCIDNVQAMKVCETIGIDNFSSLIVGFPNETQSDMDESAENMRFLYHLKPPHEISTFALLNGSPCDLKPQSFGIVDSRPMAFKPYSFLPKNIAGRFVFHVKDFERAKPAPSYDEFIGEYERWRVVYSKAKKSGERLLEYRDGGSFLTIADRRYGEGRSFTLDKAQRRLYLYCSIIRDFEEIRQKFKSWDFQTLSGLLDEMVDFRLMFREKNLYLSLALPCVFRKLRFN